MQVIITTKNLAQSFFTKLSDVILPPKCLCCSESVGQQGTICGTCFSGLNVIGKHKCHKCGLPFQFDMGEKALCQACSMQKPRYDIVRAYCTYEKIGADMAIKLKFSDKTHLAPYMAKMLNIAGSSLLGKVDAIAPIPLYHTRKLRRKYNQAALLAQNLARISGIKYEPFLLKRTRNTKKQTTLPKNLRMKNMEGAFTVNKNFAGKKILLVDDVMTTGATINAAAVALKDTGVKKVYGLVFARVE